MPTLFGRPTPAVAASCALAQEPRTLKLRARKSHLFTACCLLATTFSTQAAGRLTIESAIAHAERDAPMLEARRAALDAASQRVGPAGEQADPELVFGIENLPVTGRDAGSVTADFMTMRKIGVSQRFVRQAKRDLRVSRAEADVDLARADLLSNQLALKEAVAQAWITRFIAERKRALLIELRPRFELAVLAIDAQLAAGRRGSADALAVRSDALDLEDRITEAEGDVLAACAILARWLPDTALDPLGDPPDWRRLGDTPVDSLVGRIDSHRELMTFAASAQAAELELRLAQAEKRPDWSVELVFAQRGPEFSSMATLLMRVDLPVFAKRRQDPLIAARHAEREAIVGMREDARREHLAALQSTIAQWQSAAQRVDRFESRQRPLARERAAAALAAYQGSSGNLNDVSGALMAELEREIDYTERLSALAMAWASLRYAFNEEH